MNSEIPPPVDLNFALKKFKFHDPEKWAHIYLVVNIKYVFKYFCSKDVKWKVYVGAQMKCGSER